MKKMHVILFHYIKYHFASFLIGNALPLDIGRTTGKAHEDETRIVDEKRITTKRETWSISREGDDFETESFKRLKSCVFAVGISVQFVIRFAVVDEDIIVVIELDIPTSLTIGIPAKFVSISRTTFICRGDDSNIFGRVYKIPIETKKSELCIIVVPTEVVPDSIAVIGFIDI